MTSPSILQELEEIFSCGQYGRIYSFLQKNKWELMSEKERGLLVRLCLLHAKELYRQDASKAAELMAHAAKIGGSHAPLLFEIGKTFAEFSHNVPNVKKALEFTEKAIEKDPNFFEAWQYKVFLCASLGEMSEDFSLFTQGMEAYQRACLHQAGKNTASCKHTEWYAAFLYHRLYPLSQEPSDLVQAMKHFEKAAKQKEMPSSFWIDYGDLLVDFSLASKNSFYTNKAAHIFWKAIGKDPEEGSAWMKLALCLTKLFKEGSEKKIYKEANKCFRRASHFFSHDPALWAGWGTLELLWGKQTKSVASLQSAAEKLEQAEREGAASAEVYTCLADALLCWGALKEDHHLLVEALNKAQHAVSTNIHWMEGWYIWGKALIELGNYFIDERYYYEACQKMTQGLALKKDPHLYWIRGIGFYKSFEFTADQTLLEKALDDFSEAETALSPYSLFFALDWTKALLKGGDLLDRPELVEKAVVLLKERLQHYASEVEDLSSFLEALYTYGLGLQILGEFMEEENLYREASAVFQAVVKLDPDHMPSLMGIAETLVKLAEATADPKKYLEAISYFEHLAKKDPEDDLIFCEWGSALLRLGHLLREENPKASETFLQEAELKLVYAASLGNGISCYLLAALYSLMGNEELCLTWIEEAYVRGHLPSVEELEYDECFENVKETKWFAFLLKSLHSMEEAEEEEE